MKILRTFILLAVLVSAAMLWITKDTPMISQSAFALSPNNHWYILMHISIMMTFMLDAIFGRRVWGWLVVVGSVGTLTFNMYDFPWLHNAFTALTMGAAVFNIVYYASAKKRKFAIVNTGVGVLVFLLGLWTSTHLFFAEVIAEIAISVGMLRRIWRIR